MTAQLFDLTPHLPTTELLIPGMRPEARRTTYVRRSRRTRATRFIQAHPRSTAWAVAVSAIAIYVVIVALLGSVR
jgi:hypothetical protein